MRDIMNIEQTSSDSDIALAGLILLSPFVALIIFCLTT